MQDAAREINAAECSSKNLKITIKSKGSLPLHVLAFICKQGRVATIVHCLHLARAPCITLILGIARWWRRDGIVETFLAEAEELPTKEADEQVAEVV